MKTIMVSLFVVALSSAQPNNWYGAGGASGGASASGWAAYATLLNKTAELWQFNMQTGYITKSFGRTQIVATTSIGIAVKVRTIGPLGIFGFGTGGLASRGSNAGNVFPYGGFADLKVGATLWHFDAGYMQIPSSLGGVTTQKVVMFGVGRSF